MNTDFSSVTNMRPSQARWSSSATVAAPLSSTSPDSSGSSPASVRRVVVLPAPFTPEADDLARLDGLRPVSG